MKLFEVIAKPLVSILEILLLQSTIALGAGESVLGAFEITPTPPPIEAPSPTSLPQPTSQPVTPTPAAQYQLEPDPSGKEGIFVIRNAPSEPMATESELLAAVNVYRRAHNLNELVSDEGLCKIADERAREAASEFSHDKFTAHIQNGDYNWYDFSKIGENLWQGSFSAVHIVEFGWDQSAGHRTNLQGDWVRGCAGVEGTTVAFMFAS